MALGDGPRPGEQLFRPQSQGPDKPKRLNLHDALRDKERERERGGEVGRKTEISEYGDKTQAERTVKKGGGGKRMVR